MILGPLAASTGVVPDMKKMAMAARRPRRVMLRSISGVKNWSRMTGKMDDDGGWEEDKKTSGAASGGEGGWLNAVGLRRAAGVQRVSRRSPRSVPPLASNNHHSLTMDFSTALSTWKGQHSAHPVDLLSERETTLSIPRARRALIDIRTVRPTSLPLRHQPDGPPAVVGCDGPRARGEPEGEHGWPQEAR